MSCIKGRVDPDSQTKLRLFADSAGYCQRPECRRRLFSDEQGADYHIAEMAHIFAAVDGGPRTCEALSMQERARYENLILLCPSCHTEIDKSPSTFPDTLISNWKQTHKATIKNALGIAIYKTRQDLRRYIEPLLRRNKAIFEEVGPHKPYSENPEAEEALLWKRKMASQIIPNNQAILLALDTNLNLAEDSERQTIELFRQHIDDLIQRHLAGVQHIASRFPLAMDSIFQTP